MNILFFLAIASCKNGATSDTVKESASLKDDNKTIESVDYLTQKEKDSILENWEKYTIPDSKLKEKYSAIVNRRKKEINQLKRNTTPYKNHRIPFNFKRYLLPQELNDFNLDSINHWVVYNEILKIRQKKIHSSIRMIHYLSYEELQSFIKSGLKNGDSVNKITSERHIKQIADFEKKSDSLRSIIYPINSDLPFGSSVLIESLDNGTKSFEFTKDVQRPLKDSVQLKTRKRIFDIWQFYENLVSNVPDIEPNGYIPQVKSYSFLSLNQNQNEDYNHLFLEHQEFDPQTSHTSFEKRIEDIGPYEVYLSIDGPDYSCGFQSVEDCCFNVSDDCGSFGYLMFYNRETKNVKTINVFYINGPDNDFRFFTIDRDGILKLIEGRGKTDRVSFDGVENKGLLSFEAYMTHEIKIMDDGTITINKDKITQEYGY